MQSSPSSADPLLARGAGFAHRGWHGPGRPENSLAAFAAALAADAGIECDVRLARNGVAVVFHDARLERMCGIDEDCHSTDSAALAAMALHGSSETIPTLDQLLRLVDGRVPLLLELKSCGWRTVDLCRAVATDLGNYAGPLAIISFDPRVGHWFARHRPHVPRGLVIDGRESWWRRAALLRSSRCNLLAVGVAGARSDWVRRLRRSGMPVLAWTVRTDAERESLAGCVDGLIWEDDGRP